VPVQFGTKRETHRNFVFIRRVPANTPLLEALEKVIDSWTVPGLARGANDMDAGPWIVTEVDGSIALNLDF